MKYLEYEIKFFIWLDTQPEMQQKVNAHCISMRALFKSLDVTEQFFYMTKFTSEKVG